MADKIVYGDKSQGQASGFPTNQKYTFQDANEVKSVVNSHADDIDTLNTSLVGVSSVIYVSKSGSNSDDGSIITKPKLSINSAITRAITLLPTESNQISVEIVDSAKYDENFELPSFVHLYAEKATINGQIIINDSCVVVARRLQNDLDNTNDLIKKTVGAGSALVKADIMIVVGNSQRGVQNTSGVISVSGAVMSVDGGIGINSKNGSEIAFAIQEMLLTNGGQGIGTRAAGASATMIGQIFRVLDDGTGTFIKTKGDGDIIDIQGGAIDVDVLYDLTTNSVLNMFANSASGSRIEDPTSIVNITTNTNKLGGTLETILAADSFSDQEPVGTDNPLQVEFGAAQGTGSDPIQISAAGVVTFNENMVVFVNLLAEYGRTGAAGESEMRFRTSINGTPVSPVLSATLSNQEVRIPLAATFEINATVGMTLSFEMLRDSAGNDSGGFFTSSTTLGGWNDSPSARLLINRFI